MNDIPGNSYHENRDEDGDDCPHRHNDAPSHARHATSLDFSPLSAAHSQLDGNYHYSENPRKLDLNKVQLE